MGVSSSLLAGAGVVGVGGSLLGDLVAGESGLLSSFASLAATGSRGTSVRGGCAFFRGGSSDSDLSRAGRCRDFFISSLSCSSNCSARSSSTLMSSGLTDLVRSRERVRLVLLRLSRSRSRSRSLSLSRPRSRSRLRLRLLLRPRAPRLRAERL